MQHFIESNFYLGKQMVTRKRLIMDYLKVFDPFWPVANHQEIPDEKRFGQGFPHIFTM